MNHEIHGVSPVYTPGDVLERLRECDPTACLFHLSGDRWVIGRMAPGHKRQQMAKKALVRELNAPSNVQRPDFVRLYRLYGEGFRSTAFYSTAQVVQGAAVRDFRARCWNARNRREAAFQEGLKASGMYDQELQTARMRDRLAEARSDHSILFRKRKTFS